MYAQEVVTGRCVKTFFCAWDLGLFLARYTYFVWTSFELKIQGGFFSDSLISLGFILTENQTSSLPRTSDKMTKRKVGCKTWLEPSWCFVFNCFYSKRKALFVCSVLDCLIFLCQNLVWQVHFWVWWFPLTQSTMLQWYYIRVPLVMYHTVYLRTHHMNSEQKEQNTGCLKNLATNLCPLMMWDFCFRMAPRRPVRPLWFSWGFPSFVGSSVNCKELSLFFTKLFQKV